MKPGLERISGLLDLLADPQSSYPIIHLAGTNGKTSTARMAAALLSAHGLTPGLFTSPHLQRVEERYEFGLQTMDAESFTAAMAELAPIADLYEERSGDPVTYFELTAALAYSWFADRAVDAAVVETGLGGRWDATNAASSDVAVITSIGLEHTQYLGETEELIAAEKLAILDEGAVLVTGELSPSVVDLAESAAREKDASWFAWGRDFEAIDVTRAVGGWLFDLRGTHEEYHEIDLRTHGRHQVHNFATAVAAVEGLLGRSLDEAGVREAAGTLTTPGRMEVIRREPIVMVDGAHNPQAMAALAASLRNEFPTTTWSVLLGVMGDKDVRGMLEQLDGLVDRIVAVAADSPRARDPEELASVAASVLDVPASVGGSVADGLAQLADDAAPVLATGSIYVVGEVRDAFGV